MNERDRLLLDVLALTDAVWLPQRTWIDNQSTNTYQLRKAFDQGLPWAAGGNEADRKAAHRLRTTLVTEGLLHAFHPKRTRVVHLKLTDAAETAMRRRIGLPGQHSAWVSMQELARRSVRPATLIEHVWISERELIGDGFKQGSREEAREAVVVEEMLLWSFPRRLVEGRATSLGLVFYRLTDTGWAWIDAGNAPADEDDAPGAEVNESARRLYFERLQVNQGRLRTAAPEQPWELGELSLPDGGMAGPLTMWGRSC